MGSPLLVAAQGWVGPSPLKRLLPAMGPSNLTPELLTKTAKDSLAPWTFCVAPTAPLVSGGAEFTEKLGNPLPRPSKVSPPGAREVLLVAKLDWTTGSLEPPPPPGLPLLPPGTARKGLSCLGPSDCPLRIPWTA